MYSISFPDPRRTEATFEQVWFGASYGEALEFLRRWFPGISEQLANELFIEWIELPI